MQISRADLVTLLNSKVITGGRQTTALKLRDFQNAMIESLLNFIDDKDVANGYPGLDADNLIDITHIAQLIPAGLFLRDDGTWAFVPGMGTDIEESGAMSGAIYSLAQTPDFVYGIYKNGVRLCAGVDFNIGGNTVVFTDALDNDLMVYSYKY